METVGNRRKFGFHGPAVEIDCNLPSLLPAIDALLAGLPDARMPATANPLRGTLGAYHHDDIVRHLGPSARHLGHTPQDMDLYGDGDRRWLIDERWGMCEIDVPRNQWQSWILPSPKIDAHRLAELSALAPLGMLLGQGGLHLLQAVSVVRDGFATLVVCPFGIEPEQRAMIAGGYKIIGPRWTALREEDGRVAMLSVPGPIERFAPTSLRIGGEQASWIDLGREISNSTQSHAFCDAIVFLDSGRAPQGPAETPPPKRGDRRPCPPRRPTYGTFGRELPRVRHAVVAKREGNGRPAKFTAIRDR